MAVSESQLEFRRIRGQAIADLKDQIQYHKTTSTYWVKSQSGTGYYTVTPTPTGFYCSCPDFVQRGAQKCKHMFAVEFSKNLREIIQTEREAKPQVICNSTLRLACSVVPLISRNLGFAITNRETFNGSDAYHALRPSQSISALRR